MDLAVLVHGVEHAASCDLTVDRNRDRWPDIAVLEKLLIDSGKALREIADELANRRSGNLNALSSFGEFAEQGRNYNGRHSIRKKERATAARSVYNHN
jgi:hypothetical protein